MIYYLQNGQDQTPYEKISFPLEENLFIKDFITFEQDGNIFDYELKNYILSSKDINNLPSLDKTLKQTIFLKSDFLRKKETFGTVILSSNETEFYNSSLFPKLTDPSTLKNLNKNDPIKFTFKKQVAGDTHNIELLESPLDDEDIRISTEDDCDVIPNIASNTISVSNPCDDSEYTISKYEVKNTFFKVPKDLGLFFGDVKMKDLIADKTLLFKLINLEDNSELTDFELGENDEIKFTDDFIENLNKNLVLDIKLENSKE